MASKSCSSRPHWPSQSSRLAWAPKGFLKSTGSFGCFWPCSLSISLIFRVTFCRFPVSGNENCLSNFANLRSWAPFWLQRISGRSENPATFADSFFASIYFNLTPIFPFLPFYFEFQVFSSCPFTIADPQHSFVQITTHWFYPYFGPWEFWLYFCWSEAATYCISFLFILPASGVKTFCTYIVRRGREVSLRLWGDPCRCCSRWESLCWDSYVSYSKHDSTDLWSNLPKVWFTLTSCLS